jgi:transposase
MPLRPYDQDQLFLLPPSLNEWVREDHPARIFSEIIDRMDTTHFRESKEEGRPAYHPKMMIKVLLWGYATGIRSSRKIEERLEQDTVFMWLAGLERPDFRTLCLFRTNHKGSIEKIFTDVIMVARAMGMATLGLVALDGSKVRANCSRLKTQTGKKTGSTVKTGEGMRFLVGSKKWKEGLKRSRILLKKLKNLGKKKRRE